MLSNSNSRITMEIVLVKNTISDREAVSNQV